VSNESGEVPFTLPRGYVDREGRIHREGRMRPATARDEVAPLQDHRVKTNPAYLTVILLARVVTKLGDLDQVYPQIIEDLPVADFAFLQSLYRRINQEDTGLYKITCPQCERNFEVEIDVLGEV
jgi:hypothetical protein